MDTNGLAHRKAIGMRFAERIAAGDAVFQSGTDGIQGLPCASLDGDGRQMSGANLFVLLQVMKDYGWVDPRFLTLRQIKEADYTLMPDAKGFGLQFLVSTGADGLPLEVPEVKRFKVFHASEVEGVAPWKAVGKFGVGDVTQAVNNTGAALIWVDGLSASVQNWLVDLQIPRFEAEEVTAAGMVLRASMARTLLEAQVGTPFEGRVESYGMADEWVEGIEGDPLSFFRAIKDAEGLAATVMAQVRQVAQEREAAAVIAAAKVVEPAVPDSGGSRAGASMGKASARVEQMFQERVAVLAVPFKEKDRAAGLGAVFYPPQKLWFVPKGLDAEAFKEWNPRAHALGSVATRDTMLSAFTEAMESIGVVPPSEIIDDGQWHHVSVSTKRSGKKNNAGSYIVSLDGGRDGNPIGTIMNKDSGEQLTWVYDGPLATPEQRARLRAEALEREAAAVRKAAALQDVAAGHAAEIWDIAGDADGHGYAVKKGISTDGLRQIPGAVLLRCPEFIGESGKSAIRAKDNYLLGRMTDAAGNIRAVQAISSDGVVKSFMRGAQKKGTMEVLGAESFEALCASGVPSVAYVEGRATGASLRAATGLPVVVCFDAGNLETVVAETAALLPQAMTAVVAVDNDQFFVERAVAYLADNLGMNPLENGGEGVVWSSSSSVRSVGLGEAAADGEWHQVAKGTYCVAPEYDQDGVVRSLEVEVVPTGGRKIRAVFCNRGQVAGDKAFAALNEAGRKAVLAVPSFASLEGRPTDWNDLQAREGDGAVCEVLRGCGVNVGQGRAAGVVVTQVRQMASVER